MTHKVLLADDSQTIQKVIKITLANEPYTLIDCKSEQDLLTNTQNEQPSLVLLDFSLSETQSGYELCKTIRKLSPNTAVLMMYGTFDTVDENALKNCGAKSKIIKPFDSTKFINLCRSLIEEAQGAVSSEFQKIEKIEEVVLPKNEEDISWVLNAPKLEDKKSDLKTETKSNNVLNEQVNDWGLKVPGIIGESNKANGDILKFPPVIETTENNVNKIKHPDAAEEVTSLPMSNDLEYPDMLSNSKPSPVAESSGITSKLVPLSQLKPTSTNEISFEENTGDIEISIENGTTSDEDIRKLEEQIKDELEHVTPRKSTSSGTENDFNDLWAADEIESLNPTVKSPQHEKAVVHELEFETSPIIEPQQNSISQVQAPILPSSKIESEIEEKLKVAMKPILEELVKEYCQKTLEKVAWEIIPDLAENLIKKELKRISDSVIGE